MLRLVRPRRHAVPIFTNIIGYIATVIGTSIMLPQTIKSLRSKKVDGLSLGMVTIYCVNCVLWFTYGLLIAAKPVVAANAIGFVVGVFQLWLTFKYGRKSSVRTD